MIESVSKLTSKQVDEFILSSLVKANVMVKIELIASDVLHQLTHQRLHADFYLLVLPQAVNGQWTTDNRQRTMDNGQRSMDNGQRSTDNGQRSMDNGQWTTDNGQRSMDNGQWTMDNGQWIKESDLDRYAMPRLLEKLLERMKGE